MFEFLPVTVDEVKKRGWNSLDVIFFTGDAYIDHPSFGTAIIARIIENEGLKVAIVPQPNWKDDLRDFKKFGKPNLFFAVSSGNMDSMVNHYTANKRLRHDDAYTPGNRHGARPDYAVTVYCQILKKLYPDVPIVIGGIEASLRRLAHYDYWSNSIKPSILIESQADILFYGMPEKSFIQFLNEIKQGKKINQISVNQTVIISETIPQNTEFILLPSFNEVVSDKILFAKSYRIIEENSNCYQPKTLVQKHHNKYVIVRPPEILTTEDLDKIYDLPFTYRPHPKYIKKPTIPAYEMIKHSITIHRGCFGGCSFCSLAIHQGKFIISRSINSIISEIERITKLPDFKGHITDLGAPSANMYNMTPKDTQRCMRCKRTSCIFPNICSNLNTSPQKLIELYEKARKLRNIHKITIGSGIRYDIHIRQLNKDPWHKKYLQELILYHVSGRLKVAPEHVHNDVLKLMLKPSFQYFEQFYEFFQKINSQYHLRQQLIPYFISNHPGCTLKHMEELSEKLRLLNIKPEQVQDFTPTPMTLASVMYATGINPYTFEKIYISKSWEERIKQKQMFFWYSKPSDNKNFVSLHVNKQRNKRK
ncbi:MAG: YgiQ family radical SAM protein [Bacteroidales bacterium]|nr:YgiQ family radical SAM protein [Bacteroidales bacterium]